MSLEKPWEKPFNGLLEELSGRWGGEAKKPKDYNGEVSLSMSTSYYTYPIYTTKISDYSLLIEISEFPISDVSIIESMIESRDNIEYLRIFINAPTPCDILIRHEYLMDKVQKAIGLVQEFQTGNADFDKRYFLWAKVGQGKSPLQNPNLQLAIMNIEPFAAVRIAPKGLFWSQEIRAKSQLEFSSVQKYTERLMTLAKMISKAQ